MRTSLQINGSYTLTILLVLATSMLLMNFMNQIAKQPDTSVKNKAYSNVNKSVINKQFWGVY
jgi:hypothetical protein